MRSRDRYFLYLSLNFSCVGAGVRLLLNMSFNFSMLGQVNSPLEAAPLTPAIHLTPQSTPQLSQSAKELPSQPSPNHLESGQALPLCLEKEIEQFEDKYEDLVADVLSGFKIGGVSVNMILEWLPVPLKRQYGELLQSQEAHLSQDSSIDELFFILTPRWDFLNPSLLAYLTLRVGNEQTIILVDKYLAELREFRMRTKINDFIDRWTGTLLPDTQEFVMKLGQNWREQSLEQLEELRNEVSRTGGFKDSVMPLKSIKASSVHAIFTPPLDRSLTQDVVSMVSNVLQQIQQSPNSLLLSLQGKTSRTSPNTHEHQTLQTHE